MSSLTPFTRLVAVISFENGLIITHKDDGGALTEDGFTPNQGRRNLMRALAKRTKNGKTVFMLHEKVSSAFRGDPLGEMPVYDAEVHGAEMDSRLAARKIRSERATARGEAHAKAVTAGASKAAKAKADKADKA